MRRLLTLFPIGAADADRAAATIASIGADLRTLAEAAAFAGALTIGLPAFILFLMAMEGL
ncbi:MAG: hypothetical protein CVT74_05005 [Alphaproteobacteria bacterium HGW-Alphaproteobacteria-13]|nr:MAG: hypothetical protein CVT74_05005 [Alphaproteobacteria bacterium HGW-Alphaproteobacteria-13]